MDQSTIKRKEIGLLFLSTYQEWAGGMIYIINLISALKLVNDDLKPEIVLLHGPKSPVKDVESIKYPYIRYKLIDINPPLLDRIKNKLSRLLVGRSIYYKHLPEIVYPYEDGVCKGIKPFFWVPDFQDWYLPHMFSEEEIKKRRRIQLLISKSRDIVVFSSQSAENDFKKFYPQYTCELKLLHFACKLPKFDHLDISKLKDKFSITSRYFMSPNQFWKHKNHKVILEALVMLKNKNLDFQIVFTGSESDYRNKDYFQSLKDYIETNQIQRWIKFLGFIDRDEQLMLMDNAISIIQPSFFEGWSTVVEDTKALSQFIILSDIEVHREQISQNCLFFDPNSAEVLSEIMERQLAVAPDRKNIDYTANIKQFGEDILKTLTL